MTFWIKDGNTRDRKARGSPNRLIAQVECCCERLVAEDVVKGVERIVEEENVGVVDVDDKNGTTQRFNKTKGRKTARRRGMESRFRKRSFHSIIKSGREEKEEQDRPPR